MKNVLQLKFHNFYKYAFRYFFFFFFFMFFVFLTKVGYEMLTEVTSSGQNIKF